jgi:hypothetical protein
MSVRIGDVKPDPMTQNAGAFVSASRGGVEIASALTLHLQPVEARNYAALLVRAADEVERMRARPEEGPPCRANGCLAPLNSAGGCTIHYRAAI